jgi:hypothetical protein
MLFRVFYLVFDLEVLKIKAGDAAYNSGTLINGYLDVTPRIPSIKMILKHYSLSEAPWAHS